LYFIEEIATAKFAAEKKYCSLIYNIL
jgi:hypothetical protein